MAVLLKIDVHHDGTINVMDEQGNPVKKAKSNDIKKMYKNDDADNLDELKTATIIVTNPCGWVYCGGHWYWRCIGK